jgi:hypothetical protein
MNQKYKPEGLFGRGKHGGNGEAIEKIDPENQQPPFQLERGRFLIIEAIGEE